MRAVGGRRWRTARQAAGRRQPAVWTDRRRLVISIDPSTCRRLEVVTSNRRAEPVAGIEKLSSKASEGTLPAAREVRCRKSGHSRHMDLRARSWTARKDLNEQDAGRREGKTKVKSEKLKVQRKRESGEAVLSRRNGVRRERQPRSFHDISWSCSIHGMSS